MSRNSRLLRERRKKRLMETEDVNPMNYVSNLSDVMLILAVGIMLALVIHWEVQLESGSTEDVNSGNQEAISFSDDDLQNIEEIPDEMEKMGNVYFDPVSGKYYIVQNPDAD